nr:peptidase M42 [Mycolicibacterium grossiae]
MAEVDYRPLLRELLATYGPVGQEDAVRAVCRRELEPLADETWVDDAGNLVGLFRGSAPRDGRATRVLAHMDELSMMVKRVESDGSLHVTPLGTMYPANFGLGPVLILGDRENLCGILTLGSEHTTKESQRIWETKPDQGDRSLDWLHVYVFTGRTPEELTAAGIRPGTRVCIDGSKRHLVEFGDYLGAYFIDDRAPTTALLLTARALAERRPRDDAYLVFTTSEEIGGVGAAFACRSLPGELTIALEVGPAEAEYATTVGGGPVVGYADALSVYDKDVADALMSAATDRGYAPQAAVPGAFESDASHAKASGHTARAGLLCVPTLSTHGYEVIRRHAIDEMADVLVDVLSGGIARSTSGP